MAKIGTCVVHGEWLSTACPLCEMEAENRQKDMTGLAQQNALAQGVGLVAQKVTAAAEQIETAQQMIDSLAAVLSEAKQRIAALEAENRALKAAQEPMESEHPLHRAIRQGSR